MDQAGFWSRVRDGKRKELLVLLGMASRGKKAGLTLNVNQDYRQSHWSIDNA